MNINSSLDPVSPSYRNKTEMDKSVVQYPHSVWLRSTDNYFRAYSWCEENIVKGQWTCMGMDKTGYVFAFKTDYDAMRFKFMSF